VKGSLLLETLLVLLVANVLVWFMVAMGAAGDGCFLSLKVV